MWVCDLPVKRWKDSWKDGRMMLLCMFGTMREEKTGQPEVVRQRRFYVVEFHLFVCKEGRGEKQKEKLCKAAGWQVTHGPTQLDIKIRPQATTLPLTKNCWMNGIQVKTAEDINHALTTGLAEQKYMSILMLSRENLRNPNATLKPTYLPRSPKRGAQVPPTHLPKIQVG